jgi:hypothetical protein
MRIEGLKRREVGGQIFQAQLKEVAGALEVFEAMLSQVLQEGPCWQVLLDQLASRWRKQDLPAMSSTHDTSSMMHIHPNIAIGSQHWFASMQTDTYSYRYTFRPHMTGQGVLNSYSRCNRIGGTSKNDEEGISLSVHLVTVVLEEHIPHQAPTIGQYTGILLA